VETNNKNNKINKAIRGLIYTLVILIPATFSVNFYSVFSAPKLAILNIISSIILLLWGLKIFTDEKFTYKTGKQNIALIAYATISILTVIFSASINTSLYGTYSRFIGIYTILILIFLTFTVQTFFQNKENIKKLLLTSTATATLISIYAIAQYKNLLPQNYTWTTSPTIRSFATIGHPIHLGIYIGINIILTLYIFKNTKLKIIKYTSILAILTQTIALYLTASRSAIIATIIVLFSIYIIKNRQKIKKHISKYLLAIFLISTITITGITIFNSELTQTETIKRTTQIVQSIEKGYIPDRISWWLSGLNMAKDKPILGWGLSTYSDIYNKYRRTDFKTIEQNGMAGKITPETAHNEYINLLATQGILGLLAFLSIIYTIYFYNPIKNELNSTTKTAN